MDRGVPVKTRCSRSRASLWRVTSADQERRARPFFWILREGMKASSPFSAAGRPRGDGPVRIERRSAPWA